MPGSASPTVERAARAGDVRLSPIAVAPRSLGATVPQAIAPVAAQLRRCRELGVTTFDLVDAPDPGFAAVCLRRAFPRPDPDLVVLVAGQPARSLAISRAGPPPVSSVGAGPAGSRRPPEETASLLSGFRRVVEARHDPRSPLGFPSFVSDLLGLRDEPGVADVCVRCATLAEVDQVVSHPGAPLASASFSLLEPELLGPRRASWDSGIARCIARDVLAGGRLDGSAWSGPGGESKGLGRAPPTPVRDLSAGYAGVLRLGFLTARRDRTLAQAAVAYVLTKPWVSTACLPLPPPRRLEEILRFREVPPLSPQELGQLEHPEKPPEPEARRGGS